MWTASASGLYQATCKTPPLLETNQLFVWKLRLSVRGGPPGRTASVAYHWGGRVWDDCATQIFPVGLLFELPSVIVSACDWSSDDVLRYGRSLVLLVEYECYASNEGLGMSYAEQDLVMNNGLVGRFSRGYVFFASATARTAIDLETQRALTTFSAEPARRCRTQEWYRIRPITGQTYTRDHRVLAHLELEFDLSPPRDSSFCEKGTLTLHLVNMRMWVKPTSYYTVVSSEDEDELLAAGRLETTQIAIAVLPKWHEAGSLLIKICDVACETLPIVMVHLDMQYVIFQPASVPVRWENYLCSDGTVGKLYDPQAHVAMSFEGHHVLE